jgi:hypothetical protein
MEVDESEPKVMMSSYMNRIDFVRGVPINPAEADYSEGNC